MDVMDLRRGLMGQKAGVTGKRYITGTLTLNADQTDAIRISVPFKPSFASICFQGSFTNSAYRTFASAFIPLAVNDLMPTGTVAVRYDATSTASAPRGTYNYSADIPYENGEVAFEPRSASFPWLAGEYKYTLIE